MPSNEIIINGHLVFEVPDSWMPVLMEYLNLVKEKTIPDPPDTADASQEA